jgi:N-acetylglucosamine kinase-like BadF-type ATPase
VYVIGIDAGGSKSVAYLADLHGRLVGQARGHGANLTSEGELGVEKALHDLMERAAGERLGQVAAICLGMAGVDRPGDAQVVRAIMRRLGARTRTLVVNDALIALVAGVGTQAPGVVLVSGTGSIAFGQDARGRAARAGGLGHVLADEGSGYWIGREALRAVVRAADERGPRTLLTAGVLAHFGLERPDELVREIYAQRSRAGSAGSESLGDEGPPLEDGPMSLARRRAQEQGASPRLIASVAHVVQAAHDAGDAVAAAILAGAADELESAARSVATRLDLCAGAFTWVLSGGVFQGLPWLAAEMARRLVSLAEHSRVQRLEVEPAQGAVSLALEEARGGARLPTYLA